MLKTKPRLTDEILGITNINVLCITCKELKSDDLLDGDILYNYNLILTQTKFVFRYYLYLP